MSVKPRRTAWWIPQLEALGGILGLTAFFLYFYGRSSLLYPGFHPFLVIVLLVAGRYGFVPGLSSALMGILDYYLLLLWQDHWDTYLPGEFSFLWPSAFLFSGMVVGEMRDGEARKYRDLSEKYLQERDIAKTATMQLDILIKAKKELEKRIFLEPNTMSDLYDVLRSLERCVIESMSSTMLSICISFVGADSVALYRRDREMFVLDQSAGIYEVPKEVEANYLPFRKGYETGHAMTIRSHGILQEIVRPGQKSIRPMGVYPIHFHEGRVRFLLAIWHAPFEKVTPEFFQMLGMIADRASTRLEFLETHQRTRESVSVDETTGFLRPVFFARRASEEVSKAFRYKTACSLMDIAFIAGEGGGIDSRSVLGAMREIVKGLLRDVDLVGFTEDHTRACFCLPHTSEEGARVVTEKLHDAWSQITSSFPLLSNVSILVQQMSFAPEENQSEKGLELFRSILRRLDSIFRKDPATGFFGGGGFFREVENEYTMAREKDQKLLLLRVGFAAPSWEDAVIFGKALTIRETTEGKRLLPESAIIGVPLEGSSLWVLLPQAGDEMVHQLETAILESWQEIDMPRIKRGDYLLQSQLIQPEKNNLFESDDSLVVSLKDLSFERVDKSLENQDLHGFASEKLDSGIERESEGMRSFSDVYSLEQIGALAGSVESLILSAGSQGMTHRELVKYSRGFAKIPKELRLNVLEGLLASGRVYCDRMRTRGRQRVGYIHSNYAVAIDHGREPIGGS